MQEPEEYYGSDWELILGKLRRGQEVASGDVGLREALQDEAH